jgi:Ca2+:H+ antiporter
LVFAGGIAGIAVLAEWIRFSTEQLALHLGPAVGSLVTISLGSLAELLLALFVLASGQAEVVHAQITGSIMATSLWGLVWRSWSAGSRVSGKSSVGNVRAYCQAC